MKVRTTGNRTTLPFTLGSLLRYYAPLRFHKGSNMTTTVLVTGGAGYIGSHICLELLRGGYEVVVVDNLANSSIVALERVRSLSGKPLTFHELDLLDKEGLGKVFAKTKIDSVIHLAGLKAVGESVKLPLLYYRTNLVTTMNLLECMKDAAVFHLVFSSSATVYGEPETNPLREDHRLHPMNPYGRTKLYIEELCRDVAASDDRWKVLLLRYFNPVGADPSGEIGEDPKGIPNNLMPVVLKVAVGLSKEVKVFGGDYPTPDGTALRDYLHVSDLALGHIAALSKIGNIDGCQAVNLGTGTGISVLEVINMISSVSGRPIPYQVIGRRDGDVPAYYTDPSSAQQLLSWKATRTLREMCEDGWRWQQKNPNGYNS